MWIRMARQKKVEDVFSKIKMAREHYEKVGLGADLIHSRSNPLFCLNRALALRSTQHLHSSLSYCHNTPLNFPVRPCEVRVEKRPRDAVSSAILTLPTSLDGRREMGNI